MTCPFCQPNPARVFHSGPLILGLWDAYPVSAGHALLVPRRHIASWIEATPEEQQERALLRTEYVAGFRQNMEQVLANVRIREEDGTRAPLRKKDGTQR